MAEYIKRDKLPVKQISIGGPMMPRFISVVYVDDIAAAPAADVVEVVRCKDCKRCFKHTTKRHKQTMWLCLRNDFDMNVHPDDFCSYGERRDTDG